MIQKALSRITFAHAGGSSTCLAVSLIREQVTALVGPQAGRCGRLGAACTFVMCASSGDSSNAPSSDISILQITTSGNNTADKCKVPVSLLANTRALQGVAQYTMEHYTSYSEPNFEHRYSEPWHWNIDILRVTHDLWDNVLEGIGSLYYKACGGP
ncbi:hypothetical protein NLG97_g5040 [Lecanicillium saksenae]|uniref:Uncharacterized protein n=1 Tax=Lecanicillium saksenae TaxID=468837 RepID=A0ACC1QXF3_9HYPO|nr:hypothetical protein NLG97_g5040 [Lecanicillium saksenae]